MALSTAAPAPPAGATGPVVAHDVVVRVTGVPADVLAGLGFDRTMALVAALRSVRRWLGDAAPGLSDGLHEAIGREPDRDTRARLIALRRDVYNGRRPRQWPAALPAGIGPALAEWHDRIREHDALRASGQATYAEDCTRVVTALRAAAADEWFRRGIATASPDFTADLMRCDRDGAPMPPRLATTLYKYVTRAATKTSPYATFTSSALGQWGGAATGPAVATGPVDRRGVVELDVALAAEIAAALARDPGRRAGSVVRVNPGLRADGGHVLVLAHAPGERLRELRPGPGIEAVLERLRALGPLRWAEAVARLGSADVLRRLIAAGLLEVLAPVADQAADHLADLRRWLGGGPDPLTASVARLADGLRRIATAPDAARRLRARDEVAAAIGRIGEVTGSPHPYRGSGWYEDTVLCSPRFAFAADRWAGVLAALTALRGVAGLFDYALPTRRAAVRAFRRRHGETGRVSFLRFCSEAVADLDEELRCPRAVPATYPRGFVEVTPLQRELGDLVATVEVRDGERRVPVELLREFARRLPAWADAPASLAFFGHPVVPATGPVTFVLNSVEGGHGRAAARVRRRLGLGPAEWTVPDDPSTVYAEVVAHAGNNVNLRSGHAPFEIAYPGVVSARPPSERIDLGELDVVYDAPSQLLALDAPRLGRRVVPVHLGGMADFLLPPAHRLLVGVFGDTPWCYLTEGLAPVDKVHTDARYVFRRHRLRVGDVVVQRATLILPSDRLPGRSRGESGFDHLVRVTQWREAVGIGPRCFVRTIPTRPDIRNLDWNDKGRKPLYLDLTSDLALGLLDQIARTPGRTAFLQEVLPDHDESWIRLDGRPHVGECVLDVS